MFILGGHSEGEVGSGESGGHKTPKGQGQLHNSVNENQQESVGRRKKAGGGRGHGESDPEVEGVVLVKVALLMGVEEGGMDVGESGMLMEVEEGEMLVKVVFERRVGME